jgi:hypothetical protein
VLEWRRTASNNQAILNQTVFDLPAIKGFSPVLDKLIFMAVPVTDTCINKLPGT